MANTTPSEELLLQEANPSNSGKDGLAIPATPTEDTASSSSRRRGRHRSSSSSESYRSSRRSRKSKKKRRRRSPSSSGSSRSSSSTSRSTVRSHRSDDPPNRIHPKDVIDRESALARKIPHVLEFSTASSEIPDAPVLRTKEARRRVQLKPNVLCQFEEAAKGRCVPKDERIAFEGAIPLPNTLSALPPVIDEVIAEDNKSTKGVLYENQLSSMQGSVLVALSALSLVINELPDQSEGQSKARGYASAAMTVLGSVAHDLTTWRREFVLRSLRVDPSSIVPNIRLEGVALNTSQAQNGERHPPLFGPDILDSIVKRNGHKSEVRAALNKISGEGSRAGVGKTPGGPRSRSARRPEKVPKSQDKKRAPAKKPSEKKSHTRRTTPHRSK